MANLAAWSACKQSNYNRARTLADANELVCVAGSSLAAVSKVRLLCAAE
jgi:hypothetical protein